jgi:hypothetical protein
MNCTSTGSCALPTFSAQHVPPPLRTWTHAGPHQTLRRMCAPQPIPLVHAPPPPKAQTYCQTSCF